MSRGGFGRQDAIVKCAGTDELATAEIVGISEFTGNGNESRAPKHQHPLWRQYTYSMAFQQRICVEFGSWQDEC